MGDLAKFNLGFMTNSDPARRLSFLYIAALSAIGLIALVSQVIIRQLIEDQRSDSKLINISGRQRMLSQRLAKDALLLLSAPLPKEQSEISQRIDSNLQEWQFQHAILRDNTNPDFDKTPNSPEVKALFLTIQPYLDSIVFAANLLLKSNINLNEAEKKAALNTILKAEPHFLDIMDKITHQYQIEAAYRVSNLKFIELVLFIGTNIILFLEGFFVFFPAARQIRTYLEELLKTNKELSETSAALHENRKLLLSSTLEAQEKEKRRIAMDLHDGLGPLIALAKLNVQQTRNELSESHRHFAENAEKHLNEIHKGLKTIASELLPPALEQFGLAAVLENLVEENQKVCSAKILLYHQLEELDLPKVFELNVYRMVQELLTNALRHAEAGEISIQVVAIDKNLVIIAEDDGKGFSAKDPLKDNGLGLKNMISRTNAFSGEIHIDSEASFGTTITIYLPLPSGLNFTPEAFNQ